MGSLVRLLPLVMVVLLGFASHANAIPAFARKYQAPCGMCHDQSYPYLNDFGLAFKERGYQFDEQAEATYRAQSGFAPDSEQRLLLANTLPLAVRTQSALTVPSDPRAGGDPGPDLRAFETLYLLAGASVYRNVSFFAALGVLPTVGLHHGALGFHDLIGPEGAVNLRVGRLLIFDGMRPEHRNLTRFGNPTGSTRMGVNPWILDSSQNGADVSGRLWQRRFFWRVAVLQGVAADGVRDLDAHKDYFAETRLRVVRRLTAGVFAYRGRTQIVNDKEGVKVRFSDGLSAFGATAELDSTRFNLFAQALKVQHTDPAGQGEHGEYTAFRVEALARLGPRWLLVARFDELQSHHADLAAPIRQATVRLDWLFLTNLRLGIESTTPLRHPDQGLVSALLDLAL